MLNVFQKQKKKRKSIYLQVRGRLSRRIELKQRQTMTFLHFQVKHTAESERDYIVTCRM